MVKNYVETDKDVEKVLSVPYEPLEPDIKDFHRLDSIIGEKGIVLPQIGNATGRLRSLLGTERLAIWSIERRFLIHRLLEPLNERIYELVKCLLEGGVGPVVGMLGEEIATPPMLSPRDFYDFVVAYDKPIIELIHSYGGLAHMHCHGNLSQILEMFLEMGLDSTHPVESPPMGDITLAEFRRRVGNKIAIKGNIQIGDLYAAPKEKVIEACGQALGVGGRDGAFILAPTASPHWPYLPERTWENYKAMIDFALEHGEYPIRL
jgi:uroporphyrinogen-III decarboxylase